jgi:hypothetical protein
MKPPSKNISKSLRGQSPAGRSGENITVSGITSPKQGQWPGESGLEPAPGKISDRSAHKYAGAVGGHFGNSK